MLLIPSSCTGVTPPFAEVTVILDGAVDTNDEEFLNVQFVQPVSTGIETDLKCDTSTCCGPSCTTSFFDFAIEATAVPRGDKTEPDTDGTWN